MAFTEQQLVAHLQDAMARRPSSPFLDDARDWYAEVAGAIRAFDPTRGAPFNALLPSICDQRPGPLAYALVESACANFTAKTRALLTELQLANNMFKTALIAQGDVFDYFSEVHGLLQTATQQVLFVDPYITTDFVRRYLPSVPNQARIRLLTCEPRVVELQQSLPLFEKQYARMVECRSRPKQAIHDRHLVIDDRVYHSGASFKDGGSKSPTSISQIVDTAPDLIQALENHWSAAQPI